jgi:hypothetical protein
MAVNMNRDRSRRIAQNEAATYNEIAAIADDAVRLERAIDFATRSRSVYRDVAYQAIYSAQLAQGQTDAAIATMRKAIRRSKDSAFKNAAIVKLALEPAFTDNREKMRLLGSIGRSEPLYYIARLTLALMHARDGRDPEALRILDSLTSDRNAPSDVREQAGSMADYLRTRSMVR